MGDMSEHEQLADVACRLTDAYRGGALSASEYLEAMRMWANGDFDRALAALKRNHPPCIVLTEPPDSAR